MSVCVNISSKEFKDTAKRLNISEGSLENIVHQFINSEGNENSFPSDSYILSRVEGQPFTEALSEKAQKLVDLKYSKPITVETYDDAKAVMNDMAQYFDPKHIGLKETLDGKYEVSLNTKVEESSSIDILNNQELQNKTVLENIVNHPLSSKYVEKTKDGFRLIKDRTGSLLESLKAVRIYLTSRGFEADYIGFTPDGYLYEKTRKYSLSDQIEAYEESEDLFKSAEQQQQVLQVLDFLKEKTGLNFKFVSSEQAAHLLSNKDLTGVNAFVFDNTAYFIKGRKFNTDIAAEEMLHPFVASIRAANSEAFNSLLKDARKAFPILANNIEGTYKSDVQEEIVTQALSRAFRQDFEETPDHNSIRDLINKFWNYVKDWFRNSGDIPIFQNTDKLYAQDLSETITIQNLAKIINSELLLGNADKLNRTAFNESTIEKSELERFQEQTSKVTTQLNNLLDSNLMSNTEVKHVAEQAVYYISDIITEALETPEKVSQIFPEAFVKDGNPMTDEEKSAQIEKIKQMDRREFVNYVTLQRLINYTRDNLFSPAGNTNIKSLDLRHKAKLIRDNFDGIIRFANDAFVIVENFPIKFNGDAVEVGENVDLTTEENYDNDSNIDNLRDDGESLQEHWQVESRTRDVMTSMSQLVRSALNKCFQVKIVDGKEVPITSEFGIKERVNAKDATSSILRWTRGAESLSHMVQLLENKVAENPWVKQIVEKLKDTSGKEADFQSQFFGVFAKAFQSYSVILKEKDSKTNKYTYKSIQVNQHPALTDVTQSIEVAFKTGMHPLFDGDRVRKDTLETFDAVVKDLTDRAQKKFEENNRNEVVDLLVKATNVLGYAVEPELVNLALDNNDTFHNMINRLNSISDNLNKATTQQNYDPFKFRGDNSISGYLADFLRPITEKLEETAVSSFYDSGKMYQSYVTPSYLTVLMNHFTSEDNRFQEWLENEYGQYEWFKNTDGSWRNVWLETLDQMSQEDRKKLFKHKVQLNFNKHNYMKNMSDTEYGLSILSEYFSEMGSADGSQVPVWFRVPMMSNKPSSEFIRMYAYTGSLMKYMLLEGFNNIFQQELSRIQTVEIRDYDKSNPNFIKNFDKNGKKFIMLDFLNKYLKDGAEVNSELGKLLDKAIKEGTEKLTPEQNSQLNSLVNTEIEKFMDAKADTIISEWKSNGIFEGAKQIANIGTEDSTVETKLREFIWNDTFASMNILELTITDPAYYKDAEDLQKRLAQIHAPGIRANVEAIDYEGKRVTDGKFRTVLLKDFDDFVSNIKDNLRVVFDRKLSELEKSGLTKEDSRYKAAAAIYESIIKQFDEINVADAQGYSSPTSYRKKAFIFGRWSRQAEDIYQKLKKGDYNYNDLQTAFQPLKPFVYGQIEKPSIDSNRNDIARPLNKLKVPVQFKNSEYLLIMADAILQNEDTGKPNLLRAIYEVMEESAENDNTKGIDTIQFESTCKSGLMAPIDIKQFYDAENGEFLAKKEITDRIYNSDGTYSSTYVYEVPFENYAIQQEVPEHFKNHEQAHGSQIRYIIPSDLESVDSDGNPVTYNYFDRGEEKHLNREEFRKEYEDNISQNIEESLKALSKELCLDSEYYSRRDRNIALSKLLLQEIWNSPRYGVELAIACSVNDETGEFNIPLGDPVQSKRVEQLINSIIKNNVNKQEIAGGPVVQVTNFGTSRQLNIRFNSKEGGLLMTRDEFEKSGREGTYEDYITKNQAGIAYFEVFAPIFSNELFENFADKNGNIDIEAIEKINPDLLKMIGYRIPTEDKYSMAPLKIVGFLPREAGDGIMLPNDITLLTGSDFDVDKFYLMRKEINLDGTESTEGTVYRNNKIVDMSWAVLTNETTASKMLTPGGFEPEKRMGYLISAYQNPAVNLTWEQLNAIKNIEDLKNLCYTDKNLCFIDTHLQFYKQNSAAATALGMAAVQKVAHAVLESDGYSVNVNDVLNFEDEEFFEVAGKKFFGRMELDGKYNDEGDLIGRTLGEFVAMFADAVKDPVANLMNINNTTMPIVTCLIRLGMPFEKVALFISQPIIRRVLSLYNSENITNFVSLADIIQRELDNIEENFSIEDDSKLKELNVLTEEELINGLIPMNSRFDTDYKILTAFQYFDKISKSIKALTYTTRFNSISNAVGPLVIDNLMKEYKVEKGDFSNIYDKAGNSTNFYNVLNNHPILGSFYKTVDMARQLLDDMPVNSNNFRQMLSSADEDIQKILLNDKKTLGELSNFYQSYLLVASGAIPVEATKENPHQGLKYYIEKFPADFMKANAKELFKGNALIDAIRLDIQNGKAILKINTTGLTTQDKEKLGDGWADLYRSGERGRKLAEHLFYYNFWRTGIAFNPKSFMGLVPVRIKNHIPGYNDSFIVHSNTYAENVNTSNVLRQFVRNNADNNKLVPRVKLGGKDGVNPQRKGKVYTFSDKDYSAVKDKYYIKIKSGNRDILLERYSVDKINGTAIYTELSLLGNNGEYFEAFVGSDYTPLSQTLETKEQKNDGELAEVSNNEVQLESTPETSPTVKEQSKRAMKIRNMLLKMFMSTGKTEEQAKAKMEEFKNKSSEEKNKYKKQMKDFIKNKFDKFGIKYDDALVEEMYNELC